MHRFARIFAAFAIGLLAAAPTAGPSAAQGAGLPALKEKWEGKWVGTWGHGCMGEIEVSDVTHEGADVVYSWWDCGDRPPGREHDPRSPISGDSLTVKAGWAKVTYTMTGPDTLEADYVSRRGDAHATFTRGGG